MPRLSVLLLGSTDRPEFAESRKVLERLARVIPAANVDAACARLEPGDSAADDDEVAVDAIVVAQAYPGQFSGDALDRLSRLAPLARVVGLLGSWCEGETRSGRPWPGTVRVYWHQWSPRCHQELGRMEQGLLSSWCLPPTASDEERLLAVARPPSAVPDQGSRGRIAIYAPSFDMRDWLCEACRRAGYETVAGGGGRGAGDGGRNGNPIGRMPPTAHLPPPATCHLPPVEGAQAAIFDAFDCRGDELDDLKRLIDAVRPAPVIVLMSFPRVDDRDRILAAGATALLSKPLVLEDLYWQIEDCKLKIANSKLQV